MSGPAVVLLLKAPRPGLVKTRLAAGIGAEAAAALYRRLVERQFAALPPGWPVEVHYAPGDAATAAELRAWLGARPEFFAQPEGDLGARLVAAAAGALARHAAGALFIGGDCPGLDEETLRAAAAALRPGGVVLGPASDGGYYLLGLRALEPELFREIPWSGPEVCALTRARAAECGLAVALLAVKDDIDTVDDLRRHEELFSEFALRAAAV